MKILLTTHQFFPEYTAGTEVLTHGVAKELQRLGHEVLVFTGLATTRALADGARFDRYRYAGIPVERFFHGFVPMGRQANVMEMEYDHHLVAGHFRKLLQHEAPDVVHFFHLGRISSSPIMECVATGLPAFYTPTDFWAFCPTKQLCMPHGGLCSGPDELSSNCLRHLAHRDASVVAALARRLPAWPFRLAMRMGNSDLLSGLPQFDRLRALYRRRDVVRERLNCLDAIFVPSRVVRSLLERYGVDNRLLRWSPYGIDLNFETPQRQPDPLGRLRVGFIGTLSEPKGAHLLVEALRKIPDLPVELRIFGNTDDFPEYCARLRSLASDDPRVSLRGTFDNAEIGHVINDLDVLVVPSLWYENTPLVVFSAQACGCPVVASDLGGLSEVVRDGENGLLFPAGETRALADALLRLHADRGLLGRLAAGSRPPRSITAYVAELLENYQAALVARRKTS